MAVHKHRHPIRAALTQTATVLRTLSLELRARHMQFDFWDWLGHVFAVGAATFGTVAAAWNGLWVGGAALGTGNARVPRTVVVSIKKGLLGMPRTEV